MVMLFCEQKARKNKGVILVDEQSNPIRVFDIKPILVLLSDLTKDQLHELGCILTDHTFQSREYRIEWALKWLGERGVSQCNIEWSKNGIEYLYSIHADLNGLIELGLAINVNTL